MVKISTRVIFIKAKKYLIYTTQMLVKSYRKKVYSNTLLVLMMMMSLEHDV